MKPNVIHTQNLQVGKIVIYGDDVGCWLELHNGEEGVEALVTLADLDALRHNVVLKSVEIRAAERGKAES